MVTEENVGQGFETVRVVAGHPDGDRILLADIERKGLARLAIKQDGARHSLQAGEEVVLAALMVVKAANHALAREGDVGLRYRAGQDAVAPQLTEPAALVGEALERNQLHAAEQAGP